MKTSPAGHHGSRALCERGRNRWSIIVTTSLCLLIWLTLQHLARELPRTGRPYAQPSESADVLRHAERQFQWHDIEPKKSLKYTPCYGKFQCARLSVPLDWNATHGKEENGRRLAVAIIKLPARVPVTHAQYGGPIVLNPGGPGESGVMQVLNQGELVQTIVDTPAPPGVPSADGKLGKYFDILSFDPRGVNNTKPGLNCFPSASSQNILLESHPDYGHLWDSESIIGSEWALATALGMSCSEEQPESEILPYVNTAQVVEDMVEIIEQECLLRTSVSGNSPANQRPKASSTEEQLGVSLQNLQKAKLQYWGTSYGSLIGSTFAAMHPDRVGRVIIDGVVDPADYYVSGGLTSLQDSDQIIAKFSEYCFQAGPDECLLYSNTSASSIEKRFTAAMMHLKANPIPLLLPWTKINEMKSVSGPAVLTYGDVHLYLLAAMYYPLGMAEKLFTLIRDIELRNTTSAALIDIIKTRLSRERPDECQEVDQVSSECIIPYITMMGPFQAISCMDAGGGPVNFTRDAFDAYLQVLKSQGRWIFPNWARNRLVCLGVSVATAWRPEIDFSGAQAVRTSHPLLIIGNSHDTVTPIANARRVSGLFPGSVVLHQDSQGHCSHSAPSMCKAMAVRQYFQTGELPAADTVCEPEYRPFVGCIKVGGCELEDVHDGKLLQAMLELANPYQSKHNSSSEQVRMILRSLAIMA